jgi:hypothetical protein
MAVTSSPFDLCINLTQGHYAYENLSTYDRKNETQITDLQLAEGRTTGEMIENYNLLTPESTSVWYVKQVDIDFGSGVVPPRSGDKVTSSDGTVYKVIAWEPNQSNIDWRLITVREEM